MGSFVVKHTGVRVSEEKLSQHCYTWEGKVAGDLITTNLHGN